MSGEQKYFLRELKPFYDTSYKKLLNWRDRYSTSVYPEKVVHNLFYGSYTIKRLFPFLSGIFTGDLDDLPNDFESGVNSIFSLFRNVQVKEISPILNDLISQKTDCGILDWDKFTPLINQAKTGNNSKVEEIEYSFLFNDLINALILLWFTHGINEKNKKKALMKTVGYDENDKRDAYFKTVGIYKNMADFSSFSSTMKEFMQPVSLFLGGVYEPLPSLF